MARYIGPACKLCRREGRKLFLKGARCMSPKCAIERREHRLQVACHSRSSLFATIEMYHHEESLSRRTQIRPRDSPRYLP